MIEIKNLTVSYDNKKVVDNISFKIAKNSFTTILGANGSGKTSLLKALVGFNKYEGEIIIDGRNRKDYNRNSFAKKVAFLMQTNSFVNGISVLEMVTYGRYPYKKRFRNINNKDYEIIEWALEKTNIKNLAHQDLSTLSGGELQRVYLAMALAQKTEILILDEPINHLDIKYQFETLELIKNLNKELNVTIILVIHDINLAARYSDELKIIKDGKLFIEGSVRACLKKEIVSKVYDVDVDVVNCNNCLNILFKNSNLENNLYVKPTKGENKNERKSFQA